jgi:hypothetical protein
LFINIFEKDVPDFGFEDLWLSDLMGGTQNLQQYSDEAQGSTRFQKLNGLEAGMKTMVNAGNNMIVEAGALFV